MPEGVSFSFLESITEQFSEKNLIGQGGYGKVYKGVLENGKEIAVKKLDPLVSLDGWQFKNECVNLWRIQHQNIVQLVEYCYDIKKRIVQNNGVDIWVEVHEKALCFEYFQRGSLDKYLSDESSGFDWCTRYKIIKGICEGVNYLHNGQQDCIVHLDLKPSNILLDENNVPKIADFGLSRLFGKALTHLTTKQRIGTLGYMPPEFVDWQCISQKFDVFSLGVIIIEIMAGPKEQSKPFSMTRQRFIELVCGNWSKRFQQSEEVDGRLRLQVKTCIEMAFDCVQRERAERPKVADMFSRLNTLDVNIQKTSMSPSPSESPVSTPQQEQSASALTYDGAAPFSHGEEAMTKLKINTEEKGSDQEAVLANIGPWGGNAGKAHSIKVASCRLQSVTIWCSDIVDALAFSYLDLRGKKHHVGPWGGPGGSAHPVQFEPSEFLVEISGTTGPYVYAVSHVVRSITLVTTNGTYGPFGHGGGAAFHTTRQSDGSICGFFGRAGGFLHAIGVYLSPNGSTLETSTHLMDGKELNPEPETAQEERREDDNTLTKIGPWGGNGDMDRDMEVVPHRLESLTVRSTDLINSLAFSYDHNGKQHTVGPWGGDGGHAFTIRLGGFQQIKGVSGTVGSTGMLHNVITSLTFTTSHEHSYGPFGGGGGTPFVVPVEDGASTVGFFGRAGGGHCIEALGVYVRTYL